VRLSTVDLFDGRLTVLTGACADRWRLACAELACAGVPIRAVSLGHELEDPTGALAALYGLDKTGCVLVRPDGHVAWASTPGAPVDTEELTQAVLALTAREPAASLVA
jgi:putative polyketide hydroxylase